MLLKKLTLNGIPLYFSTKSGIEVDNKANHFTILIGKNASGKSETLKEICHLLIRSQIKNDFKSMYVDTLDHYLDRNYKNFLHRGESNLSSKLEFAINNEVFNLEYIRTNKKREFRNYLGNIEYLEEQSFRHYFKVKKEDTNEVTNPEKNNIICVSSGQFDKFPVLQSMGLSSNTGIKYSYIGVQNDVLSSRYDSTLSLKIGEIGHSIIRSCVESKKVKLDTLLKTLGFSEKVKLKYKINQHALSTGFLNQDTLRINGTEFSSIGLGKATKLDSSEIPSLKKALDYFSQLHTEAKDNERTVSLNTSGESNAIEASNLYYATKVNAVEITDIYFESESGTSSLSVASSGQINLLNIFFGIASCIEDNSLILIDEPEISLHAEWQMNFIPLIKETFSKYKKCHYIIATHAPMIISNIGTKNSSILNMTTKLTVSSEEFNHQSSDYINSYLFETPGPNNETLNREVVSLLSAISKRKILSQDKIDKAKLLIKWTNKLIDGDPTKELINILEEALKAYIDDK
jgi:predicted ATPase